MRRPGSTAGHTLQAEYGTERRALAFYNKQMLEHLNAVMGDFVTPREMMFVTTADGHGECHCSFRAGLTGFVKVVDEKTLAYPQYRGNGVMDSLGNMAENPHIGFIFIDVLQTTVGLHVNGKARVLEIEQSNSIPGLVVEPTDGAQAPAGRRPERWVLVTVEGAYIHCSKHIQMMQKLDKAIHWGTDDVARKGGDLFGAKACDRPWNPKQT